MKIHVTIEDDVDPMMVLGVIAQDLSEGENEGRLMDRTNTVLLASWVSVDDEWADERAALAARYDDLCLLLYDLEGRSGVDEVFHDCREHMDGSQVLLLDDAIDRGRMLCAANRAGALIAAEMLRARGEPTEVQGETP